MRRWRLQAAEGLPDGPNHPNKGGFGSHANIGTRLAPPGSKKGPGGGGFRLCVRFEIRQHTFKTGSVGDPWISVDCSVLDQAYDAGKVRW